MLMPRAPVAGLLMGDGWLAYACQISPISDPVANITELEAENIVVALQTFISEQDQGSHIKIMSDSLASVYVF